MTTGSLPNFADDASADASAASLNAMWPLFVNTIPGAWSREAEGAVAFTTGLAMATMNGVLATGRAADPVVVAKLLDEVAARTSIYCLQTRPDADSLGLLASSRDMSVADHEPLMVLDEPGRLTTATEVSGLEIRTLASDDLQLHLDVFARSFEIHMDALGPLRQSSLLTNSKARAYIGSIGGQAVATSMGFVLEDHVGIFNVGTLPNFRGRGFGGALTARATLDGLAAGARYAFLQSSAMGLHVYEQLGFRTLEDWTVWVPPDLA